MLFVGRLDNRSKKLFTLIDIWYRLCKLYPQWKLIIVGDGPDKDVLINKAKDISNIEFKGYQDPREYYEKASIFV